MVQDEETIRQIEVLEDLWGIKTREVERLLKARQGSSYRESISLLREQITEIEEKLLNLPKDNTKGLVTFENAVILSSMEKSNENPW